MNRISLIPCLFLLSFALRLPAPLHAEEPAHPGAVIYEQQCAECHGKIGEGVAGKHEEPLTGHRSLAALTRLITRTMPEDDPGTCIGDDAAQVAAFIFDAFYSPAAQARLHPVQIDLSRLTVPQYRTVVAELVGSFRGGLEKPPVDERGLKARYSGQKIEIAWPDLVVKEKKSDEKKKKDRINFGRVDRHIAFSFADQSPDPGTMEADDFTVRWEGSIIADETGPYEFVVKTENGARLWVNDPKNLLIDAWVTPGPEIREEKKSVFLLGGRSYPIALEFFKYHDKTASIELQWKPPHGIRETIPHDHLFPRQVRPTMVVHTAFPADDRSVGYERGTGVSKAWDQATTEAAITVADYLEENLAELSGAAPEAQDRLDRLKDFSRRFVQTAFRRPVTDDQQALIARLFENVKTPEIGVRRLALFTLKSPHFLYPDLRERDHPDDYDVAARLALNLWDSLPDAKLLEAAAAGKLQTREGISEQAHRMLADERTKTKLRAFFHQWLDLERAESISKDPQAFPGFDEVVLADLRRSLLLFIDQVVWSESSDYRELLRADYLLLNGRLARFYGKGEIGDDFQRVAFDPKERAGLVTHPYLMSSLAHSKYTSPIHRGVFLTRNVLGNTLKSPPMAVQFEDSRFDPTLTMREKVTEMTRATSCMGCHSVINPLGFALEQYDAIGRWRTEDNHKPVDPAADLATDDGATVRLTGARDIAEFAAGSENAQRAFVLHLFHHTVKQEPAAFSADTMETLRRSFIASEFNIQKLLTDIAVVGSLQGLPASDSQLAQK